MAEVGGGCGEAGVVGEGGGVGDDGRPLEPRDDVGGGAVAPVVAPPLPLALLTTVPLPLAPYPEIRSEFWKW